MLRTIALTAVLLAGPALAQGTSSGSQGSEQQSGEKAKGAGKKAQGAKGADANASKKTSDDSMGYGTPAGTEAKSDAKQASDGNPKTQVSKTPQQEKGASVTQTHQRAEAGTLTGRVVSAGENTLTIEAPDGMRDLQLTGRTEVRGEGRTSASQLRPGDLVRVSLDLSEGLAVAKRIEVRSAGTKEDLDLTPPPGSATPPGSTVTPSATPGGTTRATDSPGGTTAPSGDTRR